MHRRCCNNGHGIAAAKNVGCGIVASLPLTSRESEYGAKGGFNAVEHDDCQVITRAIIAAKYMPLAQVCWRRTNRMTIRPRSTTSSSAFAVFCAVLSISASLNKFTFSSCCSTACKAGRSRLWKSNSLNEAKHVIMFEEAEEGETINLLSGSGLGSDLQKTRTDVEVLILDAVVRHSLVSNGHSLVSNV